MNNFIRIKQFKKHGLAVSQVLSRRNQSSSHALKNRPDQSEIEECEDILKAPKRVITKKPQKPPFVKNFLLGKFDTDLLAYPEVFSKEETEQISQNIQQLETLTQNIKDKPSREQFQAFAKHRLMGLQLPTSYGGRGYSLTEISQCYEVLSQNSSYTSLLHHDRLGIQTVYKKGSDKQKEQYLFDLINGKKTAAMCVSEASSCDPRHLDTTARESNNNWVLNGQKDWIVNGETADTMIVFAQTKAINKIGLKEEKVSVFIVDRNSENISSELCQPLGVQDIGMSTIKFIDTPVPKENVLGELNKGEDIATSVLTEFRLLTAPSCITLTKELINKFINYCKSDTGKIVLSETELVKRKLSKMIIQLYVMESMTYMTTGLMDIYENQDCELEAAIVKVFTSEQCLKATMNSIEFLGSPSYMQDHWSNILFRNAFGNVIMNETNENIKIVIALLGLQHAGAKVNEDVKKMRNPLYNPAYNFKRMWTHRKQMEDRPDLNLLLKHYLHPALLKTSEHLEYAVLRLQFATETLLARCGPEVVNKHADLQRLAEAIIDTYAMAACLSRASRSYCIGLKNADHEMTMASVFCQEAVLRVKTNLNGICDGPYITDDEVHCKIGDQAFHWGEYFCEHPTKREF